MSALPKGTPSVPDVAYRGELQRLYLRVCAYYHAEPRFDDDRDRQWELRVACWVAVQVGYSGAEIAEAHDLTTLDVAELVGAVDRALLSDSHIHDQLNELTLREVTR